MSGAATARPQPAGPPQPLAAQHLPGLLAVQRACYGDAYVETAEVYARRLASPANCSLVLATDQGRVCAYLAAYRSRLHAVTPLHGDFEGAAQPDTLYLHDMAVLPECAGQGLAGALLAAVLAQARAGGLAHAALVAVQGSQPWWQRRGFSTCTELPAAQRQRLASYGGQARYMTLSLLN